MRIAWLVVVCACGYHAPAPGNLPGTDGSVIGDGDVDAPPGAWLAPFAHRRPIAIDGSQVTVPSSGPLVDFPLLVSATIDGIQAASLAAGADLVFTDATGLTRLDSELELLSANRVVAWVKVPSLAAADTTLYLYYGNASPGSTNPQAVWSGYKSVWHLNQDPGPGAAGDIGDATANGKDGTAHASMNPADSVEGNIGRAIRFDGVDDFINVPSAINLGDAFTISAWINVAQNAINLRTIFSNSLSGLDKPGFRLFVNSFGTTDHKLLFETSNGGSLTAADLAVTSEGVVPFGTWVHVAAVVDRAAGVARLFVDGVDLTVDSSIRTMFANNTDLEIGRMGDLYEWQGMIDEVELASAKLPPEWIKTAFDSQKPGSTFLTVGAEETAP